LTDHRAAHEVDLTLPAEDAPRGVLNRLRDGGPEDLGDSGLAKLARLLTMGADALHHHYADFRARTGDDGQDAFLSYLKSGGLIDDRSFLRAHASPPVHSTIVEVNSTRGTYELLEAFAEGGMAKIHLGLDRSLRRDVAIKVLKPEFGTGPLLKRFVREARITGLLEHPSIIPVYALESRSHEGPAFVMKLVQGKTFGAVVRDAREAMRAGEQKPADEARARVGRIEAFLKVCEAIGYAHSRGVLHRDLKPANIMIGEFGAVYVMDWGLARPIARGVADQSCILNGALSEAGGEAEAFTRLGQVVGTPLYMSPEQASGRDLDERSDVYSLGLILFELTTLRRARVRDRGPDRVQRAVRRASRGDLRPVVHRRPEVAIPRELKAVVERATQRRREDRYGSVEAFTEDLRRFLRGQAVEALPERPLQRLGRALARHREHTLLVFLLLVLLATWGMNLMAHHQRQESTRTALGAAQALAVREEATRAAHGLDRFLVVAQRELWHLAESPSLAGAARGRSGDSISVPLDLLGLGIRSAQLRLGDGRALELLPGGEELRQVAWPDRPAEASETPCFLFDGALGCHTSTLAGALRLMAPASAVDDWIDPRAFGTLLLDAQGKVLHGAGAFAGTRSGGGPAGIVGRLARACAKQPTGDLVLGNGSTVAGWARVTVTGWTWVTVREVEG
jgi:serine/threonine protein kinase